MKKRTKIFICCFAFVFLAVASGLLAALYCNDGDLLKRYAHVEVFDPSTMTDEEIEIVIQRIAAGENVGFGSP